MTTIAQISDLHFNRIDESVLAGLSRALGNLAPDVIAVSGDVTQRARPREFRAFVSFIERFSVPRVVVPGNHDVSLTNPFQRFLRRLARFRSIVEPDPTPVVETSDVFVIGMDTTRSFTIKGGKLGHRRIARVHERLVSVDPKKLRVLVCHHPVHALPGHHADWVDGMALLEERVDVILSGHHHQSESEVKTQGGSTLLVRAGTAASTRQRGEKNAFNVLRTEVTAAGTRVIIDIFEWNESVGEFQAKAVKRYLLSDGVWKSEA